MIVKAVENDLDDICSEVDFVFSALDMDKEDIKRIENTFASKDIPVVSNNSAHRWTDNIPMVMPEINHDHLDIIKEQQAQN